MCLAEEAALLQAQEATAIEGKVLVAKQLRGPVEQKLGHVAADDYLWDLLHRHGWKKKAPRPGHPKGEARKEKRAVVKKQMLRERASAFSAVCPLAGETYSLVTPVCSAAAMSGVAARAQRNLCTRAGSVVCRWGRLAQKQGARGAKQHSFGTAATL